MSAFVQLEIGVYDGPVARAMGRDSVRLNADDDHIVGVCVPHLAIVGDQATGGNIVAQRPDFASRYVVVIDKFAQ
jgi:hypothetical protein